MKTSSDGYQGISANTRSSELRKSDDDPAAVRQATASDLAEECADGRALVAAAHREWMKALDAIDDPVFMHDRDSRVMRSNRAYAERAGMSTDEVIGKPYFHVFPKQNGPLPSCHSATLDGGTTEEEFRLDSGEIYLSRVLTIRSAGGDYLYSLHIMKEITQRRRAEEALIKHHGRLLVLNSVKQVLARAIDPLVLFGDVCRIVVEEAGCRMAWVGQLGQDPGSALRPAAWCGIADRFLPPADRVIEDMEQRFPMAASAIKTGHVEVINDIRTEARHLSWQLAALNCGFASGIALPLIDEGDVFGVLEVYSAKPAHFDGDDRALFQEISVLLAYVIATLRVRQKQQRTSEQLRKGLEDTVKAVAAMIEMRDPYTAGHERRVAELAAAIGREIGLTEEEVHGVYIAATIHDVGKIQIPAEILSKPGRLSAMEFGLIKEHPATGYDIMKNIEFPLPIAPMILQHHERLDGSGYPQGLKGEAILFGARILTVADVVEAMASHRPYRPGLGLDAALAEIRANSGVFYDPLVVEACMRLFIDRGYAFA